MQKADNVLREQSEVVPIFTQLSTIERDTFEGWLDYLQVYYTNFEVLHDRAVVPYRVTDIILKPHYHSSKLITIFFRCILLQMHSEMINEVWKKTAWEELAP